MGSTIICHSYTKDFLLACRVVAQRSVIKFALAQLMTLEVPAYDSMTGHGRWNCVFELQ